MVCHPSRRCSLGSQSQTSCFVPTCVYVQHIKTKLLQLACFKITFCKFKMFRIYIIYMKVEATNKFQSLSISMISFNIRVQGFIVLEFPAQIIYFHISSFPVSLVRSTYMYIQLGIYECLCFHKHCISVKLDMVKC